MTWGDVVSDLAATVIGRTKAPDQAFDAFAIYATDHPDRKLVRPL